MYRVIFLARDRQRKVKGRTSKEEKNWIERDVKALQYQVTQFQLSFVTFVIYHIITASFFL